MMQTIVLKNIRKVYPGNIPAVQDFSLEIFQGEFLVLVGPSGCGKSTVLRMIAGLDEISSGELWMDGALSNQVEAKSRDIAMVFQSYALYPHMTVYKNMALGLELRHLPREEIDRKIRSAAKALDIEHLLNRRPKRLSGGQRQRVALGRAIVREPRVFLLDEPLSNLDAELRVKMRMLIGKLHQNLDAAFVYVTHDQTEAMTLADRICVMDGGFIQQVDTPQNLYDFPCNLFVAGFIGSPRMNLIPATLEGDGNRLFFQLDAATVFLPSTDATASVLPHYLGRQIIAGIRPENIFCDEEIPDRLRPGIINATIALAEPLGAEQLVHVSAAGQELIVRTHTKRVYRPGTGVKIALDSNRIHLFSGVSQQALFHGVQPEVT